jgi:hypothetical protein
MAAAILKVKKIDLKNRHALHGTRARFDAVAETLEGYARRGVFRGFSQVESAQAGKTIFRLLWHRNRVYEFIFDVQKNTMHIPQLLPNIAADSEMYADLKRFIKEKHTAGLPEHRRIDSRKAQVLPHNRRKLVSLTLQMKDGDDEYAARKLIHLVHEVFLVFLMDGRYYEYMVENFDLDPDHV